MEKKESQFEYTVWSVFGKSEWKPAVDPYYLNFATVMRNGGFKQVAWGAINLGQFVFVRVKDADAKLPGPPASKEVTTAKLKELILKDEQFNDQNYCVNAFYDVDSTEPDIIIKR